MSVYRVYTCLVLAPSCYKHMHAHTKPTLRSRLFQSLRVVALAAVAAGGNGNEVVGLDVVRAQDGGAVPLGGHGAHDLDVLAPARVAAAHVDTAFLADGDAVVGVARHNVLVVRADGADGRGQNGDDGGSDADHFGLLVGSLAQSSCWVLFVFLNA